MLLYSIATLALASLAVAAPSSRNKKRQASFYTPPSTYASQQNGAVLNSRTFQPMYNGKPIQARGIQLLYRTQGLNNTALATATTLFIPQHAQPNKLITYQIPEDSDAQKCAPSVEYYGSGLSSTNDDDLFLIGFLNLNYSVVVPDYEGPNSAFTAGRLEGHGVLDSVKAVLNYKAAGFAQNSKIVGTGYSGGAIATGWAAILHPSYASQLNVVGWASGGTPANLTETLQYIDGGLFAGLGFGGIGGLLNADATLEKFILSIATPALVSALNYVNANCESSDVTNFAFKKFQSTAYTSLGASVLSAPQVTSVTQQEVMGYKTGVPTAPMYVYHTRGDEIIPYATAQTMVQRYCAAHIRSLIFETSLTGEHLSGELLFYPQVLNFIQDRFNDVPPVNGCFFNTTSLPLIDPGTAPQELQLVFGELATILTGDIGMNDEIAIAELTAAAAKAGNLPSPVSSVLSKLPATVTGGVTAALPGITIKATVAA